MATLSLTLITLYCAPHPLASDFSIYIHTLLCFLSSSISHDLIVMVKETYRSMVLQEGFLEYKEKNHQQYLEENASMIDHQSQHQQDERVSMLTPSIWGVNKSIIPAFSLHPSLSFALSSFQNYFLDLSRTHLRQRGVHMCGYLCIKYECRYSSSYMYGHRKQMQWSHLHGRVVLTTHVSHFSLCV